MKKTYLFLISLLIASTSLFAEKLGDVVKAGNSAYMLVCELNTPEQNANFQRNINIMQRSAHAINIAKEKIQTEKDPAKKAEYEKALKSLERDFKTNDELMQKTYAFSSHRKYRMMFLETNICIPLSSKELSELKDENGKPLDPMKVFQRGNTSLYIASKVIGVKENQELQRMISYVVKRRAEMEKLRKDLVKTTDASKQMELTKQLGATENALNEAEENLRKNYGIKSKSDYLIETAKLKLYLILTPEELAKIEAQQGKK